MNDKKICKNFKNRFDNEFEKLINEAKKYDN